MDKSYLTEAFKELDILNEETFSLNDMEAPEKLSKFADGLLEDPAIDIIDTEAHSEEELQDSYIGKVIIDCEVCHSKIYKNPEDIHIANEDSDVCNEDEECPFCYSSDGFKIVGQVAPYKPEDEIKVEIEDKEVEEPEEVNDEEETKVEESLTEGLAERVRAALSKYKRAAKVEEACICEKCGKEPCECEGKEELDEASKDDALAKISAKVAKNIDEGINSHFDEFKEEAIALSGNDSTTCDDVDEFLDKIQDEEYGLTDAQIRKLGDIITNAGKTTRIPVGESFEKVDLETDDQILHVSSEAKPEVEGEEMIAPLEPETKAEIDNEVDAEVEDDLGLDTDLEAKPEEDETIDYSLDDFDEDSFDGLGESYLKEVYDNVNSFKTSSVSLNGNSLVVEGVINFNSGKNKATKFIFEAAEATSDNKVRFNGLNEQISRGKKSFKLAGKLEGNKFISESLNYNYRAKDENGKTTRLYGTVKA